MITTKKVRFTDNDITEPINSNKKKHKIFNKSSIYILELNSIGSSDMR